MINEFDMALLAIIFAAAYLLGKAIARGACGWIAVFRNRSGPSNPPSAPPVPGATPPPAPSQAGPPWANHRLWEDLHVQSTQAARGGSKRPPDYPAVSYSNDDDNESQQLGPDDIFL